MTCIDRESLKHLKILFKNWVRSVFFYCRLIDLARKLDKADREALGRCAQYLTRMGQYSYAAEVYTKMGDMKSLISMRVDAKHWDDVRVFLFSKSIIKIHLIFCLIVSSSLPISDIPNHSFLHSIFNKWDKFCFHIIVAALVAGILLSAVHIYWFQLF